MYTFIYIYVRKIINIYIYIYKHIYMHIFKEKTKVIFTENISATAFINSLLSTSHFSLMLHFKTNLLVV